MHHLTTAHHHHCHSPRFQSTSPSVPSASPGHHHHHHPSRWSPPAGGHPTGIHIYNCVAKQKVPLVLRTPHFATWYACGPTVYDATHIGHASCYVKQDLIQRTLRDHFHIQLVTAMNVTDVDDKIIERSMQLGEPWQRLTQRYESDFWSDLAQLGCAQPNVKLRVSEHMPQIVAFVQRLLDGGHAYAADDGSVYFEVAGHPAYGKLQRLSVDASGGAEDGATRQSPDAKRNAADFALWKGRVEPAKHEPHWTVPWSPIGGRPGWHIECSAMASHVFGAQIDFHAGGLDLRFPHHENEEAQSCAHHECDQWVNYWIHAGQLNVLGDNAKMSKSLRNTVAVADMLRSHSATEFRVLCLLSNYQNAIEFGPASMDVARSIVQKLNTFAGDCEAFVRGDRPVAAFDAGDVHARMADTGRRIDEALRDNFNTAKSIERLLELLTHCNRVFKVKPPSSSSARRSHTDAPATLMTTTAGADLSTIVAVNQFVDRYRSLWALGGRQQLADGMADGQRRAASDDRTAQQLQRVMSGVLRARQNIRSKAMQTRKQELFLACDEIRDSLRRAGVLVKDNSGGSSTWSLDESGAAPERKG